MATVETERLVIRPPEERDRDRFVELFTDPGFTIFSPGVHDLESANTRFDGMLRLAQAVPYAKQPVIERATGTVVGYSGVGTVEFEGTNRLEWGWRFVDEARGKGFATEATNALLQVADSHDSGELLCIIAPDNHASRRVADKVGFRWWRSYRWPEDSQITDLLLRSVGQGGPALLAPADRR